MRLRTLPRVTCFILCRDNLDAFVRDTSLLIVLPCVVSAPSNFFVVAITPTSPLPLSPPPPRYSAVGTERMGAYLLTYFTQSQHVAPQSSADVGYGFGQGGG